MKKMTRGGLTAYSLLVLFVVLAAANLAATSKTRAEETKGDDQAGARKWEYVVISEVNEIGRGSTGSNIKFSGVAVICIMQESGCQKMPVEGADKSNALAMAMARLGNEGWELVGESPVPISNGMQGGWFFKRRKM